MTCTGSLKNDQNKKCSDSQHEIYTYFKYVLKKGFAQKNSIEGKDLPQLKIYETNLDVFLSCWKKLAVVEWKIISTVGDARAVMAVAVVERFEQKPFYGLSAKIKQVAVLQRMPSVEVRVHDFTIKYRLALLTEWWVTCPAAVSFRYMLLVTETLTRISSKQTIDREVV